MSSVPESNSSTNIGGAESASDPAPALNVLNEDFGVAVDFDTGVPIDTPHNRKLGYFPAGTSQEDAVGARQHRNEVSDKGASNVKQLRPRPHYSLDPDGVHWVPVVQGEGKLKAGRPVWICDALRVVAESRAFGEGAENWGRLLEFKDHDGNRHRVVVEQGMHYGPRFNTLLATLADAGLSITTHARDRWRLTDYIQSQSTRARARIVSHTGWVGDRYVTPDRTLGPRVGGEMLVFQPSGSTTVGNSDLSQRGSLDA